MIEQFIGRRVVGPCGAFGNLTGQQPGGQGSQREQCRQSLEPACAPRATVACNQLDGRRAQLATRHGQVDQTDAQRRGTAQRASAQHKLQRLDVTEQAGRPHRSAVPGKDTQLHLRETEACVRILGADAIVAGKCQFQAAPQAEAADRRDRWEGQGFEAMEDLMDPQYVLFGRGYPRHIRKCLYIRTGDEAARLARYDDHTPWMHLGNLHQRLIECLEYLFGQDIRAAVGVVETDPGNALGVLFNGKMSVHAALPPSRSSSRAPP